MRIFLPLCGVGLIIGFLLGIALYTDRANRAGVLGLSENLLQSLRERVALQVAAYLEPASHAVLLGHSMLGRGGATDQSDQSLTFAASVLDQTTQITNVLFADAAGNFMLVTRTSPAGATKTKQVKFTPAGRTTTWTTRDPAGAVIERHEDPTDTYDARTRSWFTGARASDDVFWTTPYIFFTERAPGITASVHGPGPDPDVIAIDIKLDALSDFLRSLAIGRSGRAYIIARSGEMIAGPDPARLLQTVDGQLKPARVDAVGAPDLVASWDHFRGEGVGSRVIEAEGRRLISIVTPLDAGGPAAQPSGRDWLLAIIVPESDFSGFVQLNTRRAASLFIVVIVLAAILAVLLVRQGLRSDRAERIIAERSDAVRAQGAAFARLVADLDHGAPKPDFTETLASATRARRVTLWRWGAQSLRCEDSFEPASGHVAGLELSRQEIPALMDALATGAELDAPDATQDRRTAPMHAVFMRPIGSTALRILPIRSGDALTGLLTLEDASRDPAARDLARAAAALLSLRSRPLVPAKEGRDEGAAPEPSVPWAPTTPSLDPALGPQHAAADSIDQATVLVLRLPALGRATAADAARLGDRIACAAQDIAGRHGIPYLKMLGATIIAAAGPAFDSSRPAADAALRIAQATIDLREACAALFDDPDGPEMFAFGLDSGPILGSRLGLPPGLFNIWGDALDGAEDLADSAPDGAVQTSEAAYLLLRQRFLFRQRGLFHRPGIGDTRSYVLGGAA